MTRRRDAAGYVRLSKNLAAGMLGPAMPGAACRGRAPLFDFELPGETDETDEQQAARLAWCAKLCAQCPALQRCRATAAPTGFLGVWAGRVRSGPRSRPYREKTTGAA